MFLTSAMCRSSDLFERWQRKSMSTAMPSAVEHHSRSRTRKFWRTVRFLPIFVRPLGLPGHCPWCFWHRQHVVWVISSEDDNTSPCRLPLLSARSVSPHRLHFAISRNTYNFACAFRRPFSLESFCQFEFCIIPTPAARHWQQRRSRSRHPQP